MDEIGQEKRRISERLARLDAERARLGDQLKELEIAERVLTRFGGKADPTGGRRRGRPARTAPPASGERRARGVQKAPSLTIRDACLKAVQAHGEGATASEILSRQSRNQTGAEGKRNPCDMGTGPYRLIAPTMQQSE